MFINSLLQQRTPTLRHVCAISVPSEPPNAKTAEFTDRPRDELRPLSLRMCRGIPRIDTLRRPQTRSLHRVTSRAAATTATSPADGYRVTLSQVVLGCSILRAEKCEQLLSIPQIL
jgi:hypothetical protein